MYPKYHDFDTIMERGLQDCKLLSNRVKQIRNVQYHVFSHVHEGYGVTKQKGLNMFCK